MEEVVAKCIILILAIGISMTIIMAIILLSFILLDKIRDKKAEKIKANIIKSLYYFCDIINVPVSTSGEFTRPNGNDAVGYINYLSDKTTGRISGAAIYLRDDIPICKECMWSIFAHEVGHYISQDVYNDPSEAGADMEGYRFIMYILSTKEKLIMKTLTDIYFRCKKEHPSENLVYPHHLKEKMFMTDYMEEVKKYYEGIRSNN